VLAVFVVAFGCLALRIGKVSALHCLQLGLSSRAFIESFALGLVLIFLVVAQNGGWAVEQAAWLFQ
jgi:hypothetical protein